MAKEVILGMNVSVGRLKRDLSALLNQVTYGNERVVVESRGKPKAVLISLEELERLERGTGLVPDRRRYEWVLGQLDALRSRQQSSDVAAELRALREGRLVDLEGGG
ncbi:type II toxin-antitoxin system Phd/YefM family antitoxin [bacterium CPR1]|nr:type II toxin-antitoxin system Phd/YefM family antitoxin [bacterium CPR1]